MTKKAVNKKDKYSDKFPDLIKKYVIQWGMVNQRQQPNYEKIAELFGVTNKTLLIWRNPESEYYKQEFDLACRECQDACDLDEIKRSAKQKATGYIRTKKYKEIAIEGPDLPSDLSCFTKKALLRWSKTYLNLEIDYKLSIPEIRFIIKNEAKKNSKEVLKVVREEKENIPGDVSAIKLLAANIGPKEKRIYEKQECNVGLNEETRTLLGIIDGSSKGILPRDDKEDGQA